MSAGNHPFYLVKPSHWPIIGSFSMLTVVLGGALALHKHALGLPIVFAGFLAIATTLFFWWRDVIREGFADHAFETPEVRFAARVGMALFIVSEVMFFSAFFWAYFDAAFFPKMPLAD